MFPLAFRRGVLHVLGLMKALNAQRQARGKPYVRQELWHMIIAQEEAIRKAAEEEAARKAYDKATRKRSKPRGKKKKK